MNGRESSNERESENAAMSDRETSNETQRAVAMRGIESSNERRREQQ